MEVDDAITKVKMVDDGEGPSSKELTTEGEAQDIEVREPTLEKESTPVNSKMETRSMSRTSSPLTPPEVHSPISRNDEVSTSKKPSSRVIKNHPGSNIIGSLDEGFRLRKGTYSALMTIAHVKSSEDLNLLLQELGEHSDEESIGVVEELDAKKDESITNLQENYNSLLEKSGEHARVAKEPVIVAPTVEKAKVEKKKIVADQKVLNKPRNQSMIRSKPRGKSLPRSQRGSRMNHVCHHYGLQVHTRPKCHKLRALKNATDQRSRGRRNDK